MQTKKWIENIDEDIDTKTYIWGSNMAIVHDRVKWRCLI